MLFCIDNNCNLLDSFLSARHYGIDVLNTHQKHASHAFAQRGQDRFEGTSWRPGTTGVPLLEDAVAWFECEGIQAIPAGDHQILIGHVLHCCHQEGEPLVYFNSRYQKLGPAH